MTRFIALFALALIIQSGPRDSFAQSRITEYYLISGNGTLVNFVDVISIKREGSVVKYWMETHYKEVNKFGDSYAKVLQSADCNSETLSNIYGVFYDKSGSVTSSGSLTEAPTPVIPGSLGDDTFQFVCASPAERQNGGSVKVDSTLKAAVIWFANVR